MACCVRKDFKSAIPISLAYQTRHWYCLSCSGVCVFQLESVAKWVSARQNAEVRPGERDFGKVDHIALRWHCCLGHRCDLAGVNHDFESHSLLYRAKSSFFHLDLDRYIVTALMCRIRALHCQLRHQVCIVYRQELSMGG